MTGEAPAAPVFVDSAATTITWELNSTDDGQTVELGGLNVTVTRLVRVVILLTSTAFADCARPETSTPASDVFANRL